MDEYQIDFFKVGMILRYMKGMNDSLVGTINIVTHVESITVYTRRWNSQTMQHEVGRFSAPIEKYKLKVLG